MRWNGSDQNPIGNPQSRGLPTWFIVPDQHVDQILATKQYAFSENKLRFAREFLGARSVYFLTHCPTPTCPNFNKLVLQTYKAEDLGQRLEELERGEYMFYDIYCDQQWRANQEERPRLAEEFRKGWDLHCAAKTA